MSRLLDLPGVGRRTAEYVLLRGIGQGEIFRTMIFAPQNDLARWLHLRKPLDYGRVMRIVDRWAFGGLIYFHLLLDGPERAGYVHHERAQVESGMKVNWEVFET